METWDAISSRRDVRSYADEPIAPADLDRIVEAAWRAPSSQNEQRWGFIVCTERQRLQELAKGWQYGGRGASSAAAARRPPPGAPPPAPPEAVPGRPCPRALRRHPSPPP